MSHPYKHAPDRAFWSRAVAEGFDPADLVDAAERPLLRAGERVMTAGSCFAANLVAHLEGAGFAYVRAEPRHPEFYHGLEEAMSYGKFSAAYGNIYTARQLLQLLRRATGAFKPVEDRWIERGVVIDPYRPGLKFPARSERELELLTAQHLAAVRRAFEAADVFVFTLGLTEAWVSAADGAVFPACPGTLAGVFDPTRHVFKNFNVEEVRDDLVSFVAEVRALNPCLRVIFTVSPVPLVATATDRHVLVATVYSKSVLRAAAQDAAARLERVAYFPSYEIVTGPQAPEMFFEPDRRNVSQAAVEAVMAAFLAACEGGHLPVAAAVPAGQSPIRSLSAALVAAECEEAAAER